jgi:hypothetical protein
MQAQKRKVLSGARPRIMRRESSYAREEGKEPMTPQGWGPQEWALFFGSIAAVIGGTAALVTATATLIDKLTSFWSTVVSSRQTKQLPPEPTPRLPEPPKLKPLTEPTEAERLVSTP